MEMHQIRYFLAVARTLNFTRAAEECNVAQPSLTRAIKNLEAELGGELLLRERASSHLTNLGRAMLPFLTDCYHSAVAAKSQADSFSRGELATVRIALSHTVDFDLVTDAFGELERVFPSLQLECHRATADDIVECLRSGDAEIALAGSLEHVWDRLDSWPLFSEEFHVAIRDDHSAANSQSLDLSDLARERVITRPYCEQWRECWSLLEASGLDAHQCHEVDSDRDAIRLLDAGLGVGLLPNSVRVGERLIRIPLASPIERTIWLYSVAGRQRSQALTNLMNLLRSADWGRFERPTSA